MAKMKNWMAAFLFAALFSVSGGQAFAVTVLCTGNAAPGGTDQGVTGHDFVTTASVGDVEISVMEKRPAIMTVGLNSAKIGSELRFQFPRKWFSRMYSAGMVASASRSNIQQPSSC